MAVLVGTTRTLTCLRGQPNPIDQAGTHIDHVPVDAGQVEIRIEHGRIIGEEEANMVMLGAGWIGLVMVTRHERAVGNTSWPVFGLTQTSAFVPKHSGTQVQGLLSTETTRRVKSENPSKSHAWTG